MFWFVGNAFHPACANNFVSVSERHSNLNSATGQRKLAKLSASFKSVADAIIELLTNTKRSTVSPKSFSFVVLKIKSASDRNVVRINLLSGPENRLAMDGE